MAAIKKTKFCVSFNNSGTTCTTPDEMMIQLAKSMFWGAENPVAASEIMSLGRHIGFQDGRRQNYTYDIGSIFYRVTVNVMSQDMSQLLE